MEKKDELGLCPLEELLPYTMSYMETLWSYPTEKRDNCIKLEDERRARLLKKKLIDDYSQK